MEFAKEFHEIKNDIMTLKTQMDKLHEFNSKVQRIFDFYSFLFKMIIIIIIFEMGYYFAVFRKS